MNIKNLDILEDEYLKEDDSILLTLAYQAGFIKKKSTDTDFHTCKEPAFTLFWFDELVYEYKDYLPSRKYDRKIVTYGELTNKLHALISKNRHKLDKQDNEDLLIVDLTLAVPTKDSFKNACSIIYGKIVNMPEAAYNTCLKYDGYVLESGTFPAIGIVDGKTLYLRGKDRNRDNLPLYKTYNTKEDATKAYEAFLHLIEMVNDRLRNGYVCKELTKVEYVGDCGDCGDCSSIKFNKDGECITFSSKFVAEVCNYLSDHKNIIYDHRKIVIHPRKQTVSIGCVTVTTDELKEVIKSSNCPS